MKAIEFIIAAMILGILGMILGFVEYRDSLILGCAIIVAASILAAALRRN